MRNEQRVREDEVFSVGVNTMNELYDLLKHKLYAMRCEKSEQIKFSYEEVSALYQFVCFMKQVKELVNWGEKDE